MQRITPFKTLDIFRGFAALWVVMDHSCDRWLGGADPKYMHNPLYAFSIRGQLGVMLFFVISGYCITAAAYGALVTDKSIWRYSYERIRRIYPPYLVTVVLTVLSIVAIQVANSHHWVPQVNHLHALPPTFAFWAGNLLLLQMEFKTSMLNVVFWSLCYEIVFYLIVGILIVAARVFVKRRGFASGAFVFVNAMGISTMFTLLLLTFYSGPDPTVFFPLDLWYQFSLGGLLFFLLEWKPETVEGYSKTLRWTVIANMSLTVACVIIYSIERSTVGNEPGNPNSRVRAITGLLFILALIGLRKIDSRVSEHILLRPLMWIGAFSYSLYLIHPVVLPYVDILCRKAGLNGSRYWIAFCIEVAISIATGRVFYLLVERWFISKRQVARHSAEHVG